MEDEAKEAAEPERSTGATDEPARQPNRFLAGLGWTVGRGTRAVADGARWVGRSLQILKSERGEPLPDQIPDEGGGPDEGEYRAEPVAAEEEAPARKSGKRSKKE